MIGIFDSGSGGLTVLRALKDAMPSADVVYFGDTKNTPYGLKNRETLTELTVDAIQKLQGAGAEHIISACNSVSASLAVSLYDTLFSKSDALIEMVGPTVAAFRGSSAQIAVCATEATIRSELYQNGFRMVGHRVLPLTLPTLAGAIEEGASPEAIRAMLAEGFKEVSFDALDVVVLACTHYPLVMEQFLQSVPSRVLLYNPAEAIAERAQQLWWPREVGNGSLRFLISKDSPTFRAFVTTLFPDTDYTIEVVQ